VDGDLQPVESFIGFIQLEKQTGAALSHAIMEHLRKLGVDANNMVAQTYDGASAMSGKENGTQAVTGKHCPHAVCVHCFSHCLNLVISASNDIKEVRSAYATISHACNFFKNSAQCVKALEVLIEELCPKATNSRLKAFCPTRCVERHDTFFIVIQLYIPLVRLFTDFQQYSIFNAMTASWSIHSDYPSSSRAPWCDKRLISSSPEFTVGYGQGSQ